MKKSIEPLVVKRPIRNPSLGWNSQDAELPWFKLSKNWYGETKNVSQWLACPNNNEASVHSAYLCFLYPRPCFQWENMNRTDRFKMRVESNFAFVLVLPYYALKIGKILAPCTFSTNQSTEPNCLHAFSLARRQLHVFTSSSDGIITLFASVLIVQMPSKGKPAAKNI